MLLDRKPNSRLLRAWRAFLWPYHIFRFWRAGLSWTEARDRFHWWVWYD